VERPVKPQAHAFSFILTSTAAFGTSGDARSANRTSLATL
jgi:hypothetical protein